MRYPVLAAGVAALLSLFAPAAVEAAISFGEEAGSPYGLENDPLTMVGGDATSALAPRYRRYVSSTH